MRFGFFVSADSSPRAGALPCSTTGTAATPSWDISPTTFLQNWVERQSPMQSGIGAQDARAVRSMMSPPPDRSVSYRTEPTGEWLTSRVANTRQDDRVHALVSL